MCIRLQPAVLGIAAFLALAGNACFAAGKPNVVLLFIDDFGWNEYKYRRHIFATPEIDSIAAEGMTLTDAYAASPTCSPSRISVITGRHPARLRMVRHIPGNMKDGRMTDEFHLFGPDPAKMKSRNWLPVEEVTLAEALKPLGYHSAFVGKWHLGHGPYHPVKNGFDEQFGVSNFGHPHSYHAPFFGSGSDTYKDAPKGKYLTEQLTDDAVAYIEKQDGKQPFLLTLFYYSAHDPFQASDEMTEKLKKENPGKRVLPLGSMIGSVDRSVGRIRAALKKKGLDDNTVLFFLGDQGGKIACPPMRGTKRGGQALYEGGARVPFLVRWPGVTKPGSSSAVPVSTIDVFPTMLDMTGGDIAVYPKLDGVSLAPLLSGKGTIDRKAVVMYRSYEDQYAAVRSGKWKYIAYRKGREELFDLEADLSEKNDVSAANPEMLASLRSVLRAFEKKMDVPGVLPK